MDVIAEVEDLERTLRRFPGLTREQLVALLRRRQLSMSFEPASSPAATGELQIWTDGASRGNPGPAAIGVVMREADGRVVAELSRALGRQTNNYAEYEAVRSALEKASELGAKSIRLHADSELVIKQLTGAYRVKNPDLLELYEEIKSLERAFPGGVRYTHVRREKNKDADALANLALDEAGLT